VVADPVFPALSTARTLNAYVPSVSDAYAFGLVHDAHDPDAPAGPSSLHSYDATPTPPALSDAEKLKFGPASLLIDPSAGPVLIDGTPGSDVSISQVRDAAGPVLAALSIARTLNVYSPSASEL
jgi:hypothetical protein